MDECAVAAGKDPIDYRRPMLQTNKDPGWIKSMNDVAAKSGWGAKLPKGQGMGFAIGEGHGTICAVVAKVTVTQSGEVKVDETHISFDSGHIVNKNGVEAQLEGRQCAVEHRPFIGQARDRDQLGRGHRERHRAVRVGAAGAEQAGVGRVERVDVVREEHERGRDLGDELRERAQVPDVVHEPRREDEPAPREDPREEPRRLDGAREERERDADEEPGRDPYPAEQRRRALVPARAARVSDELPPERRGPEQRPEHNRGDRQRGERDGRFHGRSL